ncbi:MAG: D-amino-acid transaminase [Alphaproteobacteria bacterium]|nr:D-amino-acid transaminase [Pseudomonadota bacterium]MCZ6483125.1 D-amino-acid transaminase [Alphaproteobacteria bacterium]MCZ6743819.1 D-amino-acid transaminase [Alphaproteobacteria bacterium]
MSRVAYVNGLYLPHRRAAVHVEDRGYQFADGVYEVIAVKNGRFVDDTPHLERLDRSLRELEIAPPMSRAALRVVMAEMLRRNRIRDGILYIQMTRGVAARDHPFPADSDASVVMTARLEPPQDPRLGENGVDVISIPDIRWKRCDIKSVSLLPNILGKQAAHRAGAFEAWQINEEGFVTEGTSTNAWIVDAEGRLCTPPIDEQILSGITRRRILKLAKREGIDFSERYFTLKEAQSAREAFITSSTTLVLPVTTIDDAVIGNGKPGTFTCKLREHYLAFMAAPGGQG